MAKVVLGNHTAVFAARSDQKRIRSFYREALGCEVRVSTDDIDRFRVSAHPGTGLWHPHSVLKIAA